MNKIKVLFVCIHNSARSQMSAAWVNYLYGDSFEADSAGLEPGVLNSLVVQVMQEIGIDISGKETKSVFALVKQGEQFDYVITVCDKASGERCPNFPGTAKRIHWSFPDPAAVGGTAEEKLDKIRQIRDNIKAAVINWCQTQMPTNL